MFFMKLQFLLVAVSLPIGTLAKPFTEYHRVPRSLEQPSSSVHSARNYAAGRRPLLTKEGTKTLVLDGEDDDDDEDDEENKPGNKIKDIMKERKQDVVLEDEGKPVHNRLVKDNDPGQDAFQQNALSEHNKYRQIHSAPALTLNKAMSEAARQYATVIANKGVLQHSTNNQRPGQGENLFMACAMPDAPSPNGAVKDWYLEVCGYDFVNSKSMPGKTTGHFTQVVWKESTELGIGYSPGVSGSMKCVYVVGRYKPPGNFLNNFPANVLKGSYDEANTCSKNGQSNQPAGGPSGTGANGGKPGTAFPAGLKIPRLPGGQQSMAFPGTGLPGGQTGAGTSGSQPSKLFPGGLPGTAFPAGLKIPRLPGGQQSMAFPGTGLPGGQTGAGTSGSQPSKLFPGGLLGIPPPGSATGVGTKIGTSPVNGPSGGLPGPGLSSGPPGSGQLGGEKGISPANSPQGTAVPGGQPGSDDFQQYALSEHNKYRQIHNAPALTLNKAMSEAARQYATVIANKGVLQHSTSNQRPGQGENLFMACGMPDAPSPNGAVKDWYLEVCGYDFVNSKSMPGKTTGHFTQVVWKESTELGIGYAPGVSGSMKCVYVVGRYKPPGNFLNNFPANVLKGSYDEANTCSKNGQSNQPAGGPSGTGANGEQPGTGQPSGQPGTAQPSGEPGTAQPSGQPTTAQPSGQPGTTQPSGQPGTAQPSGQPGTAQPTGQPGTTQSSGEPGTASPQGTAVPGGQPGTDDFQQYALSEHNKYRQIHNAPGLTLNKAMSEAARQYATVIANKGVLQHSTNNQRPGQGENLFMACAMPDAPSPNGAVKDWYLEVCGYDFVNSKSKPGKTTGHFTQVVWKESTELGIGYAPGVSGSMKCVYVVGRYKPPGNFLNNFPANVLKGSYDEANTCSKNGQSNQPAGGPSGTGANVGQPGTGQPSGQPGTAQPSGELGTAQPSGQPGTTQPSGQPGATQPSGQPGTTQPSGEPGTTQPSGQPGTTQPTGEPGTTQPSGEPGATQPTGEPGTTQQTGEPGTTQPSGQPGTTQPTGEPGTTQPSGQPGTTQPSGQPGTTQPTGEPGTAQPSGQPGTTQPSGQPGTTQPTGQPGTAQPSGQPGTTQPSGQPGTTQPTGQPGTAQPAGQPGTAQPTGQPGTAQPSGQPGTTQPTGEPGTAQPTGQPGTGQSTGQPGTAPPTGQSGTGQPTGQPGTAPPTGQPGTAQPTGQSGIPTASQTVDEFEKQALEQHNVYRETHNAPKLSLDRDMCKSAEKYAEWLASQGVQGNLNHSSKSSRPGQGESIFAGCNADIEAADITRIWYNEVCHYDFSTYKSTTGDAVGHFTQIVWKASDKFGIGRAFTDKENKCVIVVARYKPNGNVIGREIMNVEKGKFSPAVCRLEGTSAKTGKGAQLGPGPIEKFQHDALDRHNQKRQIHAVPLLILNKEMSKQAEEYAKNLARKSIEKVALSQAEGESIYATCDGTVTGSLVSEAWYSDVCNYDFDTNKSKGGPVDPFTQMVWKASTEMGIGTAVGVENQKGCVFVVARYKPSGNVPGQNKYNVFKGAFDEKTCANSKSVSLLTPGVTGPTQTGLNPPKLPIVTMPTPPNQVPPISQAATASTPPGQTTTSPEVPGSTTPGIKPATLPGAAASTAVGEAGTALNTGPSAATQQGMTGLAQPGQTAATSPGTTPSGTAATPTDPTTATTTPGTSPSTAVGGTGTAFNTGPSIATQQAMTGLSQPGQTAATSPGTTPSGTAATPTDLTATKSTGGADTTSAAGVGSTSPGATGTPSAAGAGSTSSGAAGTASAAGVGSTSPGAAGTASAAGAGSTSPGAAGTASAAGVGSTSPGAAGTASAAGVGSTSPGATGTPSAAGVGSTSPGGAGSTSPGAAGTPSAAGVSSTSPGGAGTTSPGGADTTPAAGVGSTSPGGAGSTPPGGAGTTPAAGVGSTSPGGAGSTPPGGADTTPAAGVGSTSPGGAGSTPPGGAGTTPAAGVGSTPPGGAGTTPAAGVGSTSPGGAGSTPPGGAGTTPAASVGSTPPGGAGTTPAAGAGSTSPGGAGSTPPGGAGTTPAAGVGSTSPGGAGTTSPGAADTTPAAGVGSTSPGGAGTTSAAGVGSTSPGGAGTTPAAGVGNTSPGGASTTSPGGAGSTSPGGASTTSPAGAGSTLPGGADTTSAAGVGSTSPGGAGTTSPGGAGTTTAAGVGSTSPGGAGTTSPGGAGSTSPGGAGTTSPGGAGTTSPGGAGSTSAAGVGGAGITSPSTPASASPSVGATSSTSPGVTGTPAPDAGTGTEASSSQNTATTTAGVTTAAGTTEPPVLPSQTDKVINSHLYPGLFHKIDASETHIDAGSPGTSLEMDETMIPKETESFSQTANHNDYGYIGDGIGIEKEIEGKLKDNPSLMIDHLTASGYNYKHKPRPWLSPNRKQSRRPGFPIGNSFDDSNVWNGDLGHLQGKDKQNLGLQDQPQESIGRYASELGVLDPPISWDQNDQTETRVQKESSRNGYLGTVADFDQERYEPPTGSLFPEISTGQQQGLTPFGLASQGAVGLPHDQNLDESGQLRKRGNSYETMEKPNQHSIQKSTLSLHNMYRRIHNSPPLKLNQKMCKEAVAYAKKLATGGFKGIKHSSFKKRHRLGESLFTVCGHPKTSPTKTWYKEVCNYDFDKHRGHGTGHFTQLVWKDTRELGVGVATFKYHSMDCVYMVARYKPIGNVRNKYAKNVLRGSYDSAFCRRHHIH